MKISNKTRIKLLILVVAYNAAKEIKNLIHRIPLKIITDYDATLLIIDDCSNDKTEEIAIKALRKSVWKKYLVLKNSRNVGYGGNQKIGYSFAIENKFDVVALLHGDGQYAPELLPFLLTPFTEFDKPDAVFGSRMIDRLNALKGGMPFYKFVGNKVLTFIQNKLLNSNLSEFHTGYRIYSVDKLKNIPFEINTNDFHFDTEIIVQLFVSNSKIIELPITTYYGDEVCNVNGLKYAYDVVKASIKARLIQIGVFYDPKFISKKTADLHYKNKLNFYSTHQVAFQLIKSKKIVLDLGCSDGLISQQLQKEKKCKVFSVDKSKTKNINGGGCTYISCDLDKELPNVPWSKIDVILLLDILEHLNSPEEFLEKIRFKLARNPKVKLIVSSGNICFFITRLMVLLGQFNYGPRGILDITHKRLFTISSLQRLLKYAGYRIENKKYIPAPYPLAIGLNKTSKSLIFLNRILIMLLPGMFSYQSLFVITPLPSSSQLLDAAIKNQKKFIKNKV
jgi:glycosyltransferase involved in cell wall biosynthesis